MTKAVAFSLVDQVESVGEDRSRSRIGGPIDGLTGRRYALGHSKTGLSGQSSPPCATGLLAHRIDRCDMLLYKFGRVGSGKFVPTVYNVRSGIVQRGDD